MSTPIKNLNLTVMSQNSLSAEGIETVEQVAELVRYRGMKGLMAINQVGRVSANEIVSALCGFLLDHYYGASQNSLRDSFAAAALCGGLEQGVRDDMDLRWWRQPGECAKRAYAIADAMIDARKGAA